MSQNQTWKTMSHVIYIWIYQKLFIQGRDYNIITFRVIYEITRSSQVYSVWWIIKRLRTVDKLKRVAMEWYSVGSLEIIPPLFITGDLWPVLRVHCGAGSYWLPPGVVDCTVTTSHWFPLSRPLLSWTQSHINILHTPELWLVISGSLCPVWSDRQIIVILYWRDSAFE